MEAKAYLKYLRISPRKVQVVLDLIRGKDTDTAMAILKNTNRIASEPLTKLLKSAVANDFGVKATYLVSWLRHLTYVRNICGHHNRFYNRMMTSRPKMLKMDSGLARCGKQFLTFVILMRIYEQSWPEAWSDRYDGLARILEGHGNASLTPMGFPEDWRDVLKLAATNEDEEAEDGR